MKSIALTGATGVVGSRLQKYFKNSNFLIYDDDIRDGNAVKKFCKQAAICDAFIHLAALVPKQVVDSDPSEAFDINVRGTLNVLEGLKQLRHYAPWLFFASTSHVYASSCDPLKETDQLAPFTLYGLTKLQGEEWCQAYSREFGLKVCAGRIFSFSDPKQSEHYFIPAMVGKIKQAHPNEVIEISGISGGRDFLTVDQICQSIEILYEKKITGTVNIGSGHCNKLHDVVQKIANCLGRADVKIIAKEDKPNFLVADTSRLKSAGVHLNNQIDSLLREMTFDGKK
jgi:nucleoside-diphosphate-sugar epimerase